MSSPGYGPNGFMIRPVGLHTWEGSGPPVTKRPDLPAQVPSIALGFGRIPRRATTKNEVLRIKES